MTAVHQPREMSTCAHTCAAISKPRAKSAALVASQISMPMQVELPLPTW